VAGVVINIKCISSRYLITAKTFRMGDQAFEPAPVDEATTLPGILT